MRINGIQIDLEHEGTHWRAIFHRKFRKGGVIQSPGKPDEYIALMNATDYEVLHYLEEQGVPTTDLTQRLANFGLQTLETNSVVQRP